MGKDIKTYEYEITTDSKFQNERLGITPELERQLESLALRCQDPKDKSILDKLSRLIEQYPKVPMLKNFLSVAYEVKGNRKKSLEIHQWLLDEHPDYLFARLNQANICIEKGELDKVPGLLGEELEIKQLYPERDVFHLSEVTSYLKNAIRYLTAIGNLEQAEKKLKMLQEIAPEHHDTEQAEFYLMRLRLQEADKRWEKEEAQRIRPKIVPSKLKTDKKDAPLFLHPEINQLYRYGLGIPPAILKDILDLPRPTLVADLERMIQDAVDRYDYFTRLPYQEKTHSFLLHAFFLLKELKAVESLPNLLALLSLDDKFLDFWLADHKTENIWQCHYQLGFYQPGLLKTFLLKPGIDAYSKSGVSEAFCQMVLHHPEKREEISAIYSEVFTRFSEASTEENLIDSEFLALAIGDTIDCGMKELLPIIRTLYEKGYVSEGINGDYKTVEKEFGKPFNDQYKRKLYTIFELYDHVLNSWSGYNEPDMDDFNSPPLAQAPVRVEKIGRNDDCPCGSGKKYKRCCGK